MRRFCLVWNLSLKGNLCFFSFSELSGFLVVPGKVFSCQISEVSDIEWMDSLGKLQLNIGMCYIRAVFHSPAGMRGCLQWLVMTDSEWDSSAPGLVWLAFLLPIMSIAVGSTGNNPNSEVKDTAVGLAFIRASGDFWCHTLELHLQKNMGKS